MKIRLCFVWLCHSHSPNLRMASSSFSTCFLCIPSLNSKSSTVLKSPTLTTKKPHCLARLRVRVSQKASPPHNNNNNATTDSVETPSSPEPPHTSSFSLLHHFRYYSLVLILVELKFCFFLFCHDLFYGVLFFFNLFVFLGH